MSDEFLPQNGILWPIIEKPEAYRAGGESAIVYVENVADGSHIRWLSSDETQYSIYGDTSGCTNFAAQNSVEDQMNRLLEAGAFPAEHVQEMKDLGYIKNGKVELSDRYNYIKSGTKPGVGNWVYKPWEAIQDWGILPEADLPYPRNQRDPVFTMEQYADPSVITPAMDAKAAKSKKWITVLYEIVATDTASLKKHLKQAPLVILVATCKPWAENVPACANQPGHAVMLAGFNGDKPQIFDTYPPFVKTLATDYKIWYAIKGVVMPKALAIVKPVKKPIPYLPYFEKKENEPAIAVYDPDTDTMLPFESGRLFKALFKDYKSVNIKVVPSGKDWIRPLAKEMITTKKYE